MILALAGGVGGAKLANGLARILPARSLTIVVNTGDDFEHLGLKISPDVDTVMYTLAGLNNRTLGWGQEGESWAFMDALKRLGGADWFLLGDRDLATHVLRTQRLAEGVPLSVVTEDFCTCLGIEQSIVPMTDDPVHSIVHTDEGPLPFQDYFVRRRCAPVFRAIEFEGAADARPAAALIGALKDPALEAIILCPSNPILSLRPILSLTGVAQALANRTVPCVAVSPFIKGQAVKGPAGKIMEELGLPATPAGIAEQYAGLVDGLMIDAGDEGAQDIPCHPTDILMRDVADQERLARETLAFASRLKP